MLSLRARAVLLCLVLVLPAFPLVSAGLSGDGSTTDTTTTQGTSRLCLPPMHIVAAVEFTSFVQRNALDCGIGGGGGGGGGGSDPGDGSDPPPPRDPPPTETAKDALASRATLAARNLTEQSVNNTLSAIDLAASLSAAIGTRTSLNTVDAFTVALAAADAQARSLHATGGTEAVVVPHATPSGALFALLTSHGYAPSLRETDRILAFDAMGEPARTEFTQLVDAFLTYETAGRNVQESVENTEWYYQDYGTLLRARSSLALGVQELLLAVESTQTSSYDTLHLDIPGVVAVDLTGADSVWTADYALLLDVGGTDTYTGNAGGAPRDLVVAAAAIDLAGDDLYQPPYGTGTVGGAAEGGMGFLLDVSGDDRYAGGRIGTNGGACGHGLGFLVDLAGDDAYVAGDCGTNGGGNGGAGFLFDANGNDTYEATSDTTNGGGAYSEGAGMLVDAFGNDTYASAGFGTNGGGKWHGRGFLFDGRGSDRYSAGSFATNGGGAYNGTGFLYDGRGRDVYEAGSEGTNGGAVGNGAIGFLLDESGDDTYNATWRGTNGGGSDGGAGFLLDLADDDGYNADSLGSNGGAYAGGLGFLFDVAGDDIYVAMFSGANGGTEGAWCASTYEEGETNVCTREFEGQGVLLDVGGRDEYRDGQGGTGVDTSVMLKPSSSGNGVHLDYSLVEWSPTSEAAPIPLYLALAAGGILETGRKIPVSLHLLAHLDVSQVTLAFTNPAELLVEDVPGAIQIDLMAGEDAIVRFNVTPSAEGVHELRVVAKGITHDTTFERSTGLAFTMGAGGSSDTNGTHPTETTPSSRSADDPVYKLKRSEPVMLVRGFDPPDWNPAPGSDVREYWGPAIASLPSWGWRDEPTYLVPWAYYNCDEGGRFVQEHGAPGVGHHAIFGRAQNGDYRTFDDNHADVEWEVHRECREQGGHDRQTSIEHIAYHWAWAVYESYHDPATLLPELQGRPTCVKVIAHSMGGLVVRHALDNVGAEHFPKVLCVTAVVTAGTPHDGTAGSTSTWAATCDATLGWQQCEEMEEGSAFLLGLGLNQHPSGTDLAGNFRHTEWTALGSTGDDLVNAMHALDNLAADVEMLYDGGALIDHGGLARDARATPTAAGTRWGLGYPEGTTSARIPAPLRFADMRLAHGAFGCSDRVTSPWRLPPTLPLVGEPFPEVPQEGGGLDGTCFYRADVAADVTRVTLREWTNTSVDRDLYVHAGSSLVPCASQTESPVERCMVQEPWGSLLSNGGITFAVVTHQPARSDEERDPFDVLYHAYVERDCAQRGDAADVGGSARRIVLPLTSACGAKFAEPDSGDEQDWYSFAPFASENIRMQVKPDSPGVTIHACLYSPSGAYAGCSSGTSAAPARLSAAYATGIWKMKVYGPGSSGAGYHLRSQPAAPTALGNATGDHWMRIEWDAPAVDGGAALTGYKIYRGNATGPVTPVATVPAGQLWYNDTSLSNGQTYRFYVAAVNDVAEGPKSGLFVGKPSRPPEAPGAESTRGNGWIGVTWRFPPAGNPPDGGEPILNYTLYRRIEGQAYDTAWSMGREPDTATDPGLTFTDTGLVTGTVYCYKATAWNLRGEGNASQETCQKFAVAPGAPNLTTTTNTLVTTNLLKDWGFENLDDKTVWLTWKTEGTETDCDWRFEHDADSGGGLGRHIEVDDDEKTRVCGVYQEVSVTGGTTYFAQAHFRFTGTPVLAIKWYTLTGSFIREDFVDVTYQPSEFSGWSVASLAATAPSNAFTARVGGWTRADSNPKFDIDRVSFSASTGSTVRLDWTLPDMGGDEPKAYNVFRGDTATAVTLRKTIEPPPSPPPRTTTDNFLARGRTYHFGVSAVNGVGEGPMSDVVQFAVPGLPLPSSPGGTAVRYDATLKANVVTWNAASTGNGYTITKYRIARGCSAGCDGVVNIYDRDVSATGALQLVDPEIVVGAKYYYYVQAVTEAGQGARGERVYVTSGTWNDCNTGADASDSHSPGTALSVGSYLVCNAKMANEDDDDYYRFPVAAGKKIRVLGSPPGWQMEVAILHPGSVSSCAYDSSLSNGDYAIAECTTNVSGDWGVAVYFAGPGYSGRNLSYSLQIEVV